MIPDKPKPGPHTKPAEKEKAQAEEKTASQSPAQEKFALTPGEAELKIQELTDLLQHVQADFENYKKRVEKEQENTLRVGKAMVIRRLLPVLDTFEHALAEHKGDTDGLKRIHNQLIAALESEGVKPIKAVGTKLDPYRHECVCEECSDKEKGTVIDEIQKGYTMNDYVVRHSVVKVSSGKAATQKEEPPKTGEQPADGSAKEAKR
jgi:molecular chaperone GrpE